MSRVLWASLALVMFAAAAHGETRLFTVRTTQPGVTIIEAVRNGSDLPVAGTNAGATFFRIDNPQGAVPCSNRIRFTASNGQTVDRQVDLCANNWDLTLAVSGGGATVPAPTNPVPASPAPTQANIPGNRQAVAIVTDDPNVTITNVFLRGQEVPIAARQDPYVQINLLGGPQGFDCQRDLGLVLSDGRSVARDVDVCAANYLVVVALTGGPRPPPPPASMRPRAIIQPLPQAPVPAPQTQLPVPPPSMTAGPEIVANMQWLFSAEGPNASFAYAIPDTDASEFTAVCGLRSRQITLTLSRSADELGPGGTVPVVFTAGNFTRSYTATGSTVSELDGLSHPVIRLSTSDPLWVSLIKEKTLGIQIGSSPAYALSLSGSAVQAKQFLAACNPAPPPLPPPGLTELAPPQPGPSGPATNYACDDGTYIGVAFDQDTAVVYEGGAPPVVLFSAPSAEGERWVAGLSQLIGLGEHIYWTRAGGYARTCQRG